MRKKSHISVAKGLIHKLDMKERLNHRLIFYVGSIWPDCVPSFITRRHCIDETYDIFIKSMEKFIRKYNIKKDMGIKSTWQMGIVMHYIADYFTFPHNKHFQGNFKEHCVYEEALKHRMYKFVDDVRNEKYKNDIPVLEDVSQICEFVLNNHRNYINKDGNVDLDCEYTFYACLGVFASLLKIANSVSYAE